MTDDKTDLVKRAETALSGLSLREPDFDALAQRIEGAVGSSPAEDPALFAAPLPAMPDEGEGAAFATTVRDSAPAPSPRDSGVIVRSADSSNPTLSVAPASFDEVDDAWASRLEGDAPQGSDVVAATAADAVDLTAHAAAEESAPLAAVVPVESRREPVSLADLARASVARRGSAEAANIAKESLAVASQSRAQGEQIAQRMQAAVAQPHAPASVPPPAPSSRSVSTIPPARPRKGDLMRGPWPGIAIAVVALAASFALYFSRPNQVTIVQTAPPVAAERPEAPRHDQPLARAATPEPAREAALDPSSLPALPRGASEPKDVSGETVAKGPAATPAPAAGAAPAAGSSKVTAEKIVLEEDHKAAAKTAPSAAPRPGDAKLRPAELSNETMTDRPSAGAAQAAVGAVLGAARQCVAGHPQPSSAQLVFGSDGQVASVNVGGPAAGTPAAACIENALKKARVQPFAASSFSLGVTVRPP